MLFTTKLAAFALAAATAVSANTVKFINQDSKTREIHFTPSTGHAEIATMTIAGSTTQSVTFPTSWIGNWFSVFQGESTANHGMLGEVTFQGWNGLTYFDVSAIVNAADKNGVKQIYPASEVNSISKTTISGCVNFPCNSAYYLPDDIQTVTTSETDLICTLGTATTSTTTKRADEEVELVARKYVLGEF